MTFISSYVQAKISEKLITEADVACHNVLAHAELNCPISLNRAVKILRNSEYDTSKFYCVRTKSWCPPCSVTIFSNGKIQATGAKTIEDARLCMKRVAYSLLHRGGYSNIKFTGFRAENMLLTYDMGVPMDLMGLAIDPNLVCTYEPSRFTAVVIRDPKGSGVTVDVFSTGKVNIKGGGSVRKLCDYFSTVYSELIKHTCESLT